MNQARQERILQRISSSFGNVIPGDILQFVHGEAGPRDPVFNITYVITASGDLYYPEKQRLLLKHAATGTLEFRLCGTSILVCQTPTPRNSSSR